MKQLLNVLKQRRIWASFFALVALVLPQVKFDVNLLTQAVVDFIQALSELLAVLLPLWSLAKPKQR